MKNQAPKNIKDIKRVPLFFSVYASELKFDDATGVSQEVQVLMCGTWNHPMYGPIVITPADITEFKKNFDSGARRDIPVTEGHEVMDEKPAVGWFTELTDKGEQGLWATTEWTPQGKTLLADKAYKYFSPEFFTEYEDPETREISKDVLVGGALTNKPYFKKMQAVVLSEHTLNKNYSFSENNNMDLKTILAKKVEDLTPEEVVFLKDHKAELSAEDLSKFGSVLEEKKATETEEEKTARVKKETEDANVAKGLNPDGTAKTEELTAEQKASNVAAGLNEDGTAKTASENKVSVNASEFKALQDMANKGAKAFAELREANIKVETSKLIFSEQNSKGKILPKDEAKAFSFMLGLTEPQRKIFAEIVAEIPSSKLFKEVGSNGGAEGTAQAELGKKIEKLMSEDTKLKYSDALKKVLASDKALGQRYAEETAGNKVK